MDSSTALDPKDRELIALLQSNVRASYHELASATGLSASTVRRRIDRLVQRDVLKLVAVPSWSRLGLHLTALIAISVDLHRLRRVGDALATMDEIVFVAIVTGAYDLIAELVLPTNEDFVRFVTQRIAPIEGIRNVQTFMVPEFVKSFEQYRLPVEPNRLYLRQANGEYAFSDDRVVADNGPD